MMQSEQTNSPIVEPGVYRHNKSGNLYEVIGTALQTETDESLVIYKALYENDSGYELFARPQKMFVESVAINGIMQTRFEKLDSAQTG